MSDWSAALIVPDQDFDGAPLLRREFELEQGHGEVASATLHASAHGVFEAFVNGQPVADDVLSPGWSAYEWRLRYRSYDVTALLQPTSVLGVALGNGWWRGRLGWAGGRNYYGSDLGLFAQLEITFADGHVQRVVSDESWTAGPSAVAGQRPLRRPDDRRPARLRRLAPAGVPRRGLDRGPSRRARPGHAHALHRPARAPGGRAVAGEHLDLAQPGATLVDFGQNLVGWVKVRVSGPAGTEITLRHAEVLEHDELGVRPLRSALATDRFILSGGDDVFEPTFTFHGFRYAEVDGWPGELADGALTAVVVSSDLAADRGVLLLPRPAQPAAQQRGVGDDRQLPRRAHRLPPARRAAGLDRRHRRLHPVGGLPVRRRGLPAGLAARPRRRAAGGRRPGRLRHPRRAQVRPRHDPNASSFPRSSRPRSGATRPSGCRGRCGRPTATGRCWPTSSTP